MACASCGAETLEFPVDGGLQGLLPGEEPGAAICTRCLALEPVAEPPASVPDFQLVSTAMPADPDAALPMAILLGLLENLALHRAAIAELLTRVERAGADPLLVLDRLAHDEALEPGVDLERRRRNLEQLL